jgi:predicted transcriptional regulator
MGAKKNDLFDKELNNCSNLAFSVSSSARILILKTLIKKGFINGPILDDSIPLHRKTVNQHLKILERTGLIEGFYIGKVYVWKMKEGSEESWKKIEWALV